MEFDKVLTKIILHSFWGDTVYLLYYRWTSTVYQSISLLNPVEMPPSCCTARLSLIASEATPTTTTPTSTILPTTSASTTYNQMQSHAIQSLNIIISLGLVS